MSMQKYLIFDLLFDSFANFTQKNKKMKTTIKALLLVVLFISTSAFTYSTVMKDIDFFPTWDALGKSAIIPIPLQGQIGNNNDVSLLFREAWSTVTIEVKNDQNEVVYRNVITPGAMVTYSISLQGLESGQYELSISDGRVHMLGDFYL